MIPTELMVRVLEAAGSDVCTDLRCKGCDASYCIDADGDLMSNGEKVLPCDVWESCWRAIKPPMHLGLTVRDTWAALRWDIEYNPSSKDAPDLSEIVPEHEDHDTAAMLALDWWVKRIGRLTKGTK